MLSECCLWRQHSNNFGCELQTYPRLSTKVFSCKCCVVWVLFECCLWRQHSDNFGRELQTYPRFSTKKKVSWKCCLNVVSGDNIETTFGQKNCFSPFFGSINVFGLWKRSKTLILSECCLWRQHWDNIRAKEVFFAFFLARNKCFRPLKKVKNTYFVRMLSLETTFRQHSLICCELQTCPVLLSTKCVLCQCCLNVVSRGGI